MEVKRINFSRVKNKKLFLCYKIIPYPFDYLGKIKNRKICKSLIKAKYSNLTEEQVFYDKSEKPIFCMLLLNNKIIASGDVEKI